jgi:hypothetical protein
MPPKKRVRKARPKTGASIRTKAQAGNVIQIKIDTGTKRARAAPPSSGRQNQQMPYQSAARPPPSLTSLVVSQPPAAPPIHRDAPRPVIDLTGDTMIGEIRDRLDTLAAASVKKEPRSSMFSGFGRTPKKEPTFAAPPKTPPPAIKEDKDFKPMSDVTPPAKRSGLTFSFFSSAKKPGPAPPENPAGSGSAQKTGPESGTKLNFGDEKPGPEEPPSPSVRAEIDLRNRAVKMQAWNAAQKSYDRSNRTDLRAVIEGFQGRHDDLTLKPSLALRAKQLYWAANFPGEPFPL